MSLDTLLSILFLLVFIVLPLLSRAFRQGSPPGRSSGRETSGRPPASAPGPERADEPPWLAEAQRRVREARDAAGEARKQVSGRGSDAEASTAPRERPLVSGDPFGQGEPRPSGRTLVPEEPFGRQRPRPGQRTLVPEEPFGRRAGPAPGGTLVPEDPFQGTPAPSRPGSLVPEDPFERGLAGRGAEPPVPGHADDTLGREGGPVPRVGPTTAPRMAGAEVGAEGAGARPGRGRRGRRSGKTGSTVEGTMTVTLVTPAYGRRRGRSAGARLGPVDLLRFDRKAIVGGLVWHEILDEPAWKRRQRRASSRPRSR